jgi:uncharacterized membrane protein
LVHQDPFAATAVPNGAGGKKATLESATGSGSNGSMLVANPRLIRRLRVPLRVIRNRPRLFASAVIGAAIMLLLPRGWQLPLRIVVGWDIGVALYLTLAYTLIARCDIDYIRRRAAREDEGRTTLLVLIVAAALTSLAAIVSELGQGRSHDPLHLALATVTILLSWALIHTIFALHYAHEFYDEADGEGGGLVFPGGAEPDYWDFVYFSFVIGMTSQVSDVGVSARAIRRTVVAHGVVSFLFNIALLALMVNIAAGAI